MSSNFYTSVLVRGDMILYRGIEKGKRIRKEVLFNPSVFVPTNKTDTGWKTLCGKNVEEFNPGTIKDTKEFVEEHNGISNFEIYGNLDFQYQYIADTFKGEINYSFDKLSICYLDIETECESGFPNIEEANQLINLISFRVPCFKDPLRQVTYSFCLHDKKLEPVNKDHIVFTYEDEGKMLEQFLFIWQKVMPDIITGWNIKHFDIPYIVNRIKRILGSKKALELSPWSVVRMKEVYAMNRMQETYEILGISVLDYMELYRKFTFSNQESFRLDHICFVELGERKEKYEGFNTLQDLYKKDFQKFLNYNHKDVQLVYKLEEKLKLLELCVTVAYTAKINMTDVFSQVRTWDTIIYNHLNDNGIVIPRKQSGEKGQQFSGAYVKEPQVGISKWVVSYDLNSLYPHLIIQYNISPETKLYRENGHSTIEEILDPDTTNKSNINFDELQEKAKDIGASLTANNVFFTNSKKGFLPLLMEKMYNERKIYKQKMIAAQVFIQKNKDTMTPERLQEKLKEVSKYENFQMARKIQLNSAYGAVGNEFFRYYDLDMAEAITMSGKLSIRWIEKNMNLFLNKTIGTKDVDYVIASDTDSLYVTLDGLVEKYSMGDSDIQSVVKFLDDFSNKEIMPFIDSSFKELSTKMNTYSQSMNMKRETISDKGLWTAKKRYILNVYMGENDVLLTEPKLKVVGVETSRSSTPAPVRVALKKCLYIIMNSDVNDLRKYVTDFKSNFYTLPADEIAFPRSCNGLKTYGDDKNIYKRATPIAARASLLYNYYLDAQNLTHKYNMIQDGEKVKFIYLKKPNPINENVIAFKDYLPKELDLSDFIDYNMQYEKSFYEPLDKILKIIAWNIEGHASLESLLV